jgi:hypothetical protein
MKMSDELAYLLEDAKRFERRIRAANDRFAQPPTEFVGALSNLFVRKNICPPFLLARFAARWLADEISPAHCIEEVRKQLEICAYRPSGSSDGLIAWIDVNVRGAWFKRNQSPGVDEGFDFEHSFADVW